MIIWKPGLIDHRGCQNVVRTSVTHSAAPRVPFICSYHIFIACVAGVIGEGEGEQGRREKIRGLGEWGAPSFFLASLAPLPLPRLRRPRRLHFYVICDLLLNRCTATWNLFLNYSKLDHWIMQFKTFYWLTKYGYISDGYLPSR